MTIFYFLYKDIENNVDRKLWGFFRTNKQEYPIYIEQLSIKDTFKFHVNIDGIFLHTNYYIPDTINRFSNEMIKRVSEDFNYQYNKKISSK